LRTRPDLINAEELEALSLKQGVTKIQIGIQSNER